MSTPAPYILQYGRCRVCGCTEENPCFDPEDFPCWWVDDQHTLCSRPRCIAAVPLDELVPLAW